jgi:4-carboxymuconolactone decarboxylase
MMEQDGATAMMSPTGEATDALDDATRRLVRLAAVIAVQGEPDIRLALSATLGAVEPEWVEEVVLQSYLFAGFPRALNAAREWRRISGRKAPQDDEGAHPEREADAWRARGEATCATVYGPFYDGLRKNIRDLHPALDAWMVVEGYGKVLGRPALDLLRRELCVVAICAAAKQDRQLHSHLHGAIHAGATVAQVDAALALVDDMLSADDVRRYRLLWARVQGQ